MGKENVTTVKKQNTKTNTKTDSKASRAGASAPAIDPGFRILAQDVTVSNDTRVTGMNNNDLIFGPSNAGKTGGYVIPNIQNIFGSLVVSDTKSQLYRKFSKELKNKGYDVTVLDFINPQNSCCYNPLANIRRYPDGRIREQDVLMLANSLVSVTADDKEPIWHLSARSYLAFLICYCLEEMPEDEQNLATICELNHEFSRPGGELAFVEWIRNHPDSFATKKYHEIESNKPADRMWASILGFANVALEPFEFYEGRHIFGAGKSIQLRDLGRKKTVLFLNVPDTDSTFDAIINIFYTQALQCLCSEADEREDGRLAVPVRIIMDDFAASAKIKDFDKIISVIRSREISVSLILQSMSQLFTMYGDAAKTIMENCDHHLILGTTNEDTAKYVGTRAFKTPEKIMNMPPEYAYLLEKGKQAQLVKKIVPYSTLDPTA